MMRSIEYPKTENLMVRDPDTHELLQFRSPHFEQIRRWHVTEKIDGTNIRVLYAPTGDVDDAWKPLVEVRGRSDRANVPQDLVAHILELFSGDKLAKQFNEFIGPERIEQGASVTIFGEGYGPGIQKGGGKYADEKRFRMFDVVYHWPDIDSGEYPPQRWRDSWCQPSTVEMIARGLGVPMAPILNRNATMADCLHLAATSQSMVALEDSGKLDPVEPEGIIARTDPYLYDERGRRVMFKLKRDDLTGVYSA